MGWSMHWERYVLEEDREVTPPYPTTDETRPEPGETDPRIQLATQRTELASERTLLAWVRTALFLIATGVAFDQGVRLLHQARMALGIAWVQSAHLVGASVTAAITLLLTIVACNHLKRARLLAVLAHRPPPRMTAAFVVAALTVLLGLLVLVALTLIGD
jgi:putative membrane protein